MSRTSGGRSPSPSSSVATRPLSSRAGFSRGRADAAASTLASALSIDGFTLGMLAFELHDQPLDALTLQAEIAARRTAAADDRQLALAACSARASASVT